MSTEARAAFTEMEHLDESRSRYSRKRIRGELTSRASHKGQVPHLGKDRAHWRSQSMPVHAIEKHSSGTVGLGEVGSGGEGGRRESRCGGGSCSPAPTRSDRCRSPASFCSKPRGVSISREHSTQRLSSRAMINWCSARVRQSRHPDAQGTKGHTAPHRSLRLGQPNLLLVRAEPWRGK